MKTGKSTSWWKALLSSAPTTTESQEQGEEAKEEARGAEEKEEARGAEGPKISLKPVVLSIVGVDGALKYAVHDMRKQQ